MNMFTYNVAFYEASAQTMTVYYEGQSLEDYVLEKRAVRLKSFASHYAPDVLALQEVNWRWWSHIVTGEDSIVNRLGYDWAGNLSTFGNGDGVNVGKDHDIYNLLLWKKDVYEATDRGVFRLNDRLYSNADQDRMCTYAILKNRETGTEILYASAHLCTHTNESMNALSLSQARTLTKTLERLAKGRTIVVGGDFNSYDTADCYRHMTETAGFLDSRKRARINHTPSMCSARVWGREKNWNNGRSTPIDYIFYKGTTAVAEEWMVLTDTYDMQANISTDIKKIGINYDLSDHQGVYTKFREVVQ